MKPDMWQQPGVAVHGSGPADADVVLLGADFDIDEAATPELAECLRTLSARYARAVS